MRASRGGDFRWSCPGCGGVRLPPRVARVVGNDPEGELSELYRAYSSYTRSVGRRRRLFLLVAVFTPLAVGLLWSGLLRSDALDEGVGASKALVIFGLGAAAALLALVVGARLRALHDQAEIGAVNGRGELRRTYRRAVARLLREEELTDDELSEIVQSTRDIRRLRIAEAASRGAQAAPLPPPEASDEPEEPAPPSALTRRAP